DGSKKGAASAEVEADLLCAWTPVLVVAPKRAVSSPGRSSSAFSRLAGIARAADLGEYKTMAGAPDAVAPALDCMVTSPARAVAESAKPAKAQAIHPSARVSRLE